MASKKKSKQSTVTAKTASIPPKTADEILYTEKLPPVEIKNLLGSKWGMAAAGLFILAAVFAFRKIANYDIGFHLAAGRWIAENFSVPYTDIFTYTVSQNEYIDIQWLYQLLMFAVQSVSGYWGLTVFNTVLIVLVFALLFKKICNGGAFVYISLPVLFLAVLTVQVRFSYRPEVVTWILILLLLLQLDKLFTGEKKSFFWLPVIILLWVNIHGLFIIGFGMMGAYFISFYVHQKKINYPILFGIGASVVAALINPYTINGALFPFYLFTRLQQGNIFQQTITELQSPWQMTGALDTELYLYYGFAALALILVITTYKNRRVHEFILLAAFFYLSYTAFRNIPVFVIYAAYIISIALSEIVNSQKYTTAYKTFNRYTSAAALVFTVICLLVSARVITGAYFMALNSAVKSGAGVDLTALPVSGSEFINKNELKGKILNKLEFGGWLEWQTGQKVYIDGRLEVIKDELYTEYMNGIKVNGIYMLLNKYRPDIIVSDLGSSAWVSDLMKAGVYRLGHYDYNSAIYIRSGFADDISFKLSDGLIAAGITDTNSANVIPLIKDAQIYNEKHWFEGFYKPFSSPVELLKMGNFAYDMDNAAVAEKFYLEFIKRSGGVILKENFYEIFFNLGSIYQSTGRPELAMMCYSNCLLSSPNDPETLNRMTEINNSGN